MALILDRKYTGKNSYYLFIRNRLLKIYPIYLTVLIISFVLILFWSERGLPHQIIAFQEDFNNLHWTTIFYIIFQNIFILTQDIASFFSTNREGLLSFSPHLSSTYPFIYTHSIIPQAWTLSIELMFYFIAPFLVKKRTSFIIFLISLSLLLRLYIYSLGFHHEPWTNKFAPTELAFFLMGIISFRIYSKISQAKLRKKIIITAYVFFISITLIYNYFPYIKALPVNFFQWGYYGLIFLLIPFFFYLFKRNKFDRLLGNLSYPIYISHVTVIFAVSNLNISADPNEISIYSVIATIILSIILNKIVMERIEVFRSKDFPKGEFRKRLS